MKEKNWIQSNIGMGYAVQAKERDTEQNTREGRRIMIKKDVVGYVQDVAGKNIFLVQFGDSKKKDRSTSLLSYLCQKEKVFQEVNDTIPDISKIEKFICQLYMGILFVKEMEYSEKVMYLYILYCLCFVE